MNDLSKGDLQKLCWSALVSLVNSSCWIRRYGRWNVLWYYL